MSADGAGENRVELSAGSIIALVGSLPETAEAGLLGVAGGAGGRSGTVYIINGSAMLIGSGRIALRPLQRPIQHHQRPLCLALVGSFPETAEAGLFGVAGGCRGRPVLYIVQCRGHAPRRGIARLTFTGPSLQGAVKNVERSLCLALVGSFPEAAEAGLLGVAGGALRNANFVYIVNEVGVAPPRARGEPLTGGKPHLCGICRRLSGGSPAREGGKGVQVAHPSPPSVAPRP